MDLGAFIFVLLIFLIGYGMLTYSFFWFFGMVAIIYAIGIFGIMAMVYAGFLFVNW